MNTHPLNMTTFWITLGVGTLVALVASWRFSRSGSHPRFRPAMGVVLMVFMAIMAVVGFLAVVFGRMVGNKLPPVMNAEERKVWEAQQKSMVPSVPSETAPPVVTPSAESALPVPSGELPAPAEALPAAAAESVVPVVEPPDALEELPEPALSLPEPAPATPEP